MIIYTLELSMNNDIAYIIEVQENMFVMFSVHILKHNWNNYTETTETMT